jgi:hypothetical protein
MKLKESELKYISSQLDKILEKLEGHDEIVFKIVETMQLVKDLKEYIISKNK